MKSKWSGLSTLEFKLWGYPGQNCKTGKDLFFDEQNVLTYNLTFTVTALPK